MKKYKFVKFVILCIIINSIFIFNLGKFTLGIDLQANESTEVFDDDFEIGILSSDWTLTGDGGVDTRTANSGSYSAWHGEGSGEITSIIFDLSSYNSIEISYWIRRGHDAFSEDPESGEDFIVEYYNDIGVWIQLDNFLGGGIEGEIYSRKHTLSDSGILHSDFQIRFRQTDGDGNRDYWHFDDVKIVGIKTTNNEDEKKEIVEYITSNDQLTVIILASILFVAYKVDKQFIKLNQER